MASFIHETPTDDKQLFLVWFKDFEGCQTELELVWNHQEALALGIEKMQLQDENFIRKLQENNYLDFQEEGYDPPNAIYIMKYTRNIQIPVWLDEDQYPQISHIDQEHGIGDAIQSQMFERIKQNIQNQQEQP